jgi:hypothetical protein
LTAPASSDTFGIGERGRLKFLYPTFAFILFDSGSSRPITVVEKDETGEVTIYPACSEQHPFRE